MPYKEPATVHITKELENKLAFLRSLYNSTWTEVVESLINEFDSNNPGVIPANIIRANHQTPSPS